MTKLTEFIQARVDALEAENANLRALLKLSYRQHDWVDEDCWYSCPKADDYCGDKPRDVCLCGADEWNAKIGAALAAPVDGGTA